ncbi:uncharacterized protein LOC126753045 [Bactrocera neohumeralis]|uniref:uncharacterized protein LOC126753045 n=1 Tax=Bactrocera neohumeralis TaxID=98809 RepID=UPI0021668B93|nr:uncharacterized protein LOC126753045 [Bactrocera neohumeralis]
MTALAEQKIVTQKLIRQESLGAPIVELFPLSSEESLKAIEEKILPENREIYVSTIKRLLQQSATRNLKNIFDDSVVLSHNLDGTHGKKRLKTYEKLYAKCHTNTYLSFVSVAVSCENDLQHMPVCTFICALNSTIAKIVLYRYELT